MHQFLQQGGGDKGAAGTSDQHFGTSPKILAENGSALQPHLAARMPRETTGQRAISPPSREPWPEPGLPPSRREIDASTLKAIRRGGDPECDPRWLGLRLAR
jgi:hypothetical protein